MIERILGLMEINNISAYKLTSDTGLNHSSVNGWKKGIAKPSFDAIIKISDYFNVTTDYLLGKSDNPTPPDTSTPYVSPDEFAIIEKLRTLPEEKRRLAMELVNQL